MNAEVLKKFKLARNTGQKQIALLIDPDKFTIEAFSKLIAMPEFLEVDCLFVGGSLITSGSFENTIVTLKRMSQKPVIIFPGSNTQIAEDADALLLLSLISGRNADLLIGKHVEVSFALKQSNLEVISTSYLLIDGGKPTSVSYMSNTTPIPADKYDIALATALAGHLLGHHITYLDCGSGALYCVPPRIISSIKNHVDSPLIVGGGIKTFEQAFDLFSAGADILVVGDKIESDPLFLREIVRAKSAMQIPIQTM